MQTYNDFIDSILNTRGRFNCEGYCERHHIVPKSLGGGNEESNLIDLYAKEHYEAHRLLAIENPQNHSLQYAWFMMSNCVTSNSNDRYIPTPEEYEEAKKSFSQTASKDRTGVKFTKEHKQKISESQKGKIISEETKKKLKENHADYSNGKHPMFGKHHTEESKKNMSMGHQNRSEEWKRKQSKSHKGHKHTAEWKKEMSERNKGENNPNFGNHKLAGANNPNAKKVSCDGMIFNTLTEMVKFYGLTSVGNFSAFLNGTKPMPRKWAEKNLKWYTGDSNGA